jgi:acyl carrier protein
MSEAAHEEGQGGASLFSAGEVKAIVHAYLTKRYPALVNLKAETPLLAGGAIDSLGVLDLMTFVGERFNIDIEDGDFDGANLASLGRLVRFVMERKRI